MIYHVALGDGGQAACDQAQPGEPLVPWDEAIRSSGRYFNCVHCHKVITGGRKHSGLEDGQHA